VGNGTNLGGGKTGEVGDGYEDAIVCFLGSADAKGRSCEGGEKALRCGVVGRF